LKLLGTQIAIARRERRWTRDALIERVGISRQTLTSIEKGSPTVAIGTVFEVATLLGVPLFDRDTVRVGDLLTRSEQRLALLPARVHEPTPEVDDDF
jgi:DNA-binding XRE family transcriptional regulator